MQTMFEFLQINGETMATLLAIILGPIMAVYVTRSLDNKRAERERKYHLLSELMRTRRARLDPAHVSALNLVELEFYGATEIRASFKAYVRHLNSAWPESHEELQRHNNEGDDLFSELLKDVAKSLGYNFDKRDLDRLGYLPTGLGEQHDNQMANSKYLREVFEGRRSIPIFNYIQNDKLFPPPPKKQITDQSLESGEVDADQLQADTDKSD